MNIKDIVEELYPDPIYDDFSEDKDYDARDILKDALESYHEAITEAPKEVKPKIARAMLDGLILGSDITLAIYYQNANIPEKFFELVDEYNKRTNIPVLDSKVRV